MKPKHKALRDLAVRILEEVGLEAGDDLLDVDAEMRRLAIDGLKLLGLDPAHELRRHLRKKKEAR